VRTIGLYDVIRPVGFEETAVVVEVAVICRDAIGAVQDCEEVGQQVDQHQQPGFMLWSGAQHARRMRENTLTEFFQQE
jgi:hypothetical protein